MKVIGITGGMASGKTTIARMFAGRGIFHLDADKLVHGLIARDAATIQALADAFPGVVHAGVVDRAALARLAASSPAVLYRLEHLLHPRVRALELRAIRQAHRRRARALILDIPLLFETDADALCDVVVAVHAPFALRRRRAFMRTGMTDAKWERLLSRQLPAHARNRMADMVIHTGLGKAVSRRKVMQLMKAWGLR